MNDVYQVPETADSESQRYALLAGRIRRQKRLKMFAGMLLILAVIGGIFSAYQVVLVTGDCMSPAVQDGQQCILNKWIYSVRKPDRMDIVIYKENGKYIVGRIMAKPGEQLEIVRGTVFLDGKEADYHLIPDSVSVEKSTGSTNMYFIVKDNLEASAGGTDLQQAMGSQLQWVHKNNIVGKIVK